ncbi:zinc finger protein ZFP2 isoform X1 [Gadus macrocephalus]|uniref:zinc finger protein ZFP2 isoform X1 n=1 Tax=Gadus macrocephalus TaxID=80720 RepID=UPI0028CB6568|nr:zinc finger protein ZFP2 isoform X1 [Gadus macrocephalus]
MYHYTYLRLSKHDTMHSVKEQYRDINPVTVNVIEANVTSSLYCGAVHGLDAPGADLVEAFLVELYRCRVCQFTSSLKSSIKTHLLNSHDDLPPAMASSGFEEEEAVVMEHIAPRTPDSPYHLELELTSESNHSDDDPMDHMGLDRMSFLLPMYGILPSMSPRSCDMGMSSNCDGGLQVAETCEVSTLFEGEDDEEEEEEEGADGEEPTIFQLKASCPLVRPPNQLDDQLAQSAHLMTLGLCRISKTPNVSTPPAQAPASVLDDKVAPPASADPLGSRGPAGQQGVKAEERPASGGCRRCGRRMRRQGKTKSGKTQSCRACQRSDRTQHAGDARAPHRHSQTLTATAQSTKAAAEHHTHTPNSKRAGKGKRHTLSIQSSGTHTEGTRTDRTRTPKAFACSRDAWLSGVFCDYKGAAVVTHKTEEEIDRRLSSRLTDTPSYQPTSRGRSHNGAESTQPHRTRKQSRSPEGNTGSKKKAPKETIGRRDLCCLLCDRKFCSRLTLRRHMGIHQGSKPYSCQLCPYRSRLKASLLQHNRIHTGEKPFQCPDPGCSYASIDRSSLLRHSRTHTQQKPYHCQHCSYSCIQKKCLDLHARRHHTGESFPCQQCPYSSPDRQLLLRHVQRHHLPLAALP